MTGRTFRVFISHGSHDLWVAGQIARCVREAGAETFLDQTDVPKGANFKKRIREEIGRSDELIALFTPWSANPSWVWVEIGAAFLKEIPIIAVFYGLEPADLDGRGQGKAILEDTNVLEINDFESYTSELKARIEKGLT